MRRCQVRVRAAEVPGARARVPICNAHAVEGRGQGRVSQVSNVLR